MSELVCQPWNFSQLHSLSGSFEKAFRSPFRNSANRFAARRLLFARYGTVSSGTRRVGCRIIGFGNGQQSSVRSGCSSVGAPTNATARPARKRADALAGTALLVRRPNDRGTAYDGDRGDGAADVRPARWSLSQAMRSSIAIVVYCLWAGAPVSADRSPSRAFLVAEEKNRGG